MKKFLLSILLSAAVLAPAVAQQRTEADAAAIANAFMQNNGYEFTITKTAKTTKVRAEKAGEITPYYIFNDTQKGGYVIVGGQEGMSDILAYSYDECFDTEDTPPAAAAWLAHYAEAAKKAADYPEEAKAEKREAAKAFLNSNFALRKSVQPLLGEIKFNQGTPYNNKCPTLKVLEGGKVKTGKAVVGCSATAFGMILRYWKYPEHSTGEKTYTFNYDYSEDVSKQMTLSVNFDSVGDYDWDNMLPTYRSGISYTTVEAEAVSKLLYHCGVALGAGYGLGGTGAVTDGAKYATYFGYDKNITTIVSNNYLDKPEVLRAMFAEELSQGRPMLCKGSNDPDKYNGHAYVMDGFDMNGLFHFNLGWDGSSNGFFEVAPVPTSAYGHQMTSYINIHPEGRLTPQEPVRRVIVEASLGAHNEQTTNIISTLKSLDTTNKYGESMICIVTADTEEDGDKHLVGLNQIPGVLLDRCDTVTGRISTSSVTTAYKVRFNTPSPTQLDIDAMFTSDSTMAVTVFTEFYKASTGKDYRFAFAYTEDNVKIDGTSYNSIARGMYPGKEGYANVLPETIEYDKQYIYEKEIPIPATINETNNASLIVMLIDGETGVIANANVIELKQINTWRANQKPAFYNEGKLLTGESVINTYDFDEEKSRMAVPVRISNPLYEKMPVEISVEDIDIADNAYTQLGEEKDVITLIHNAAANSVDSTLMLYLNITDKFQSSESSTKLVMKYNGNVIAEQTVNFGFIKSVDGINPYTVRIKGTLANIVPTEAADTMSIITLGGRLCGLDLSFIRENLKVNVLDMRKTEIVAGPGTYYGDYTTEDNLVGVRMFYGVEINKIYLPEGITKIDNYAFYQNEKLSHILLGQEVSYIGSYAFSGCTALERVTIPASVKELGRNAFKGCPIVCVICEGETPAKLGSKVFDGADLASATLVVPNEAAIEAYKAEKQWKDFGNIITYDQYLTAIAPVTEETQVTVKGGKIIVSDDADVTIYTFTGKQVAAGKAGEYALPAGNYIVKVGNKAVKVRL
ncbi:MAG: C10 family peptidase [Bacteroidaceae bacterium]|nr:C10 family peptidase [Bacteroidaceae bacterium]